jgi:muramoyltetrapeptide carboxypeptidase
LPFSLYILSNSAAHRTPYRQKSVNILRPPRLRKNDVVGIVAPASPPSTTQKIERGVRYLEKIGYRVKLGTHVMEVHGYLAGNDDQRASDLNTMFGDRQVRAIIAVRGGYGTPRLLEKIDYGLIRRNPKILVGYSDLTALQLAIYKRTGLITFSGPMLGVEFCEGMDPFTEEFFWRLLTSPVPLRTISNPGGRPLTIVRSPSRNSSAVGRLLGGNLSMIVSLLGTPFQPRFTNSILFLEEVGEEPYRVDRMLTQLRLAGVFEAVQAMLIGSFIDCVPSNRRRPSLTTDEVLHEMTRNVDVPILSGLAYGHTPRKLTMPIGVRAKVDAATGSVQLLESAVR